MIPIPLRTVYTNRVIGSLPGTSTAYDVQGMVEQLDCSGIVSGDFKTANPFYFKLFRQQGRGHNYRTSGIYNGAGFTNFDLSDSRLLQVAVPAADPADLDWARTDDNALASIFDQLRGNSNLVVDILEGGATLKMLSNVRKLKKEVLKTITSTKKSKRYKGLTTGQQRLDFFTQKWLEGRYGWMPLIRSIYDAVETLGKRFTSTLVPVRGRSRVELQDTTISGYETSMTEPRRRVKRKLVFRTEILCLFELPASNQIYDWTSLNPAGILWELTPFSFVADWLVNVGDLLSLWENYFIFANKFVRGYRTRSYREDVETSYSASLNVPYRYAPNGDIYDDTYSYSVSGGDSLSRKLLWREVLTTLPLPSQGIRVRPELNAKRMLDAVSLFHTFTKRDVRRMLN